MKIDVDINVILLLQSGAEIEATIRGHLHAPAQPHRGQRIFWPYGSKSFVPPAEDEQDCFLTVLESDWHTILPGKIIPTLILGSTVDDMPESELTRCDNLVSLESILDGARHLLENPKIRWSKDVYQWWPLPAGENLIIPKEISDELKKDW